MALKKGMLQFVARLTTDLAVTTAIRQIVGAVVPEDQDLLETVVELAGVSAYAIYVEDAVGGRVDKWVGECYDKHHPVSTEEVVIEK